MSRSTRNRIIDQIDAEELYLDPSSSEEVEEVSQKLPKRRTSKTQRKSTQNVSTQSKTMITDAEFNSLVNDVVRKILASQTTKKLVTRDEITKSIFQLYKVNPRNLFKQCMEEATNRLKYQFGFELKEVKGSSTGKTTYILLDKDQSSSELKVYAYEGMTDDMIVQHSITFIVLAIIALNGEAIYDESLIQHLNTLDIEDVPGYSSIHEFVDKILPSQGYTRRIPVPNDNGTRSIKYSLGVRAYAELGKDGIFDWIARIHGDELGDTERNLYKRETERNLNENYDGVEDANLLDNDLE